MTASVMASSTKKIAVGSVQAIHAMFSMAYPSRPNDARCNPLSPQLGFTRVAHPELSKSDRSDFDRERVGVRGDGLSMERNPSPGATRRPLPLGEVKESESIGFD